jgi:integrase
MQILQERSKAKGFLDSIKRSSTASAMGYRTGLLTFERFLNSSISGKMSDSRPDLETIIELLLTQKINVYELLDQFVQFLLDQKNLSNTSVRLYVASVRSYLGFYDIDIISTKFKRRVKLPKVYREDELPIDVQDVRNILLKCTNRRLKAYILVLASSGCRAVEACSLRLQDINFMISPTTVHVRKEYAKTRVARDIYITDEATAYLKELVDWKYRNRPPQPHELVFSVYNVKTDPRHIYRKIITQFEYLLKVAGMDARKENSRRRKITLHSFRRFTNTVLSDNVSSQYADWFLGHSKSPYYSKKESERRAIYTKVMKYLTFLDYSLFETTGKNIDFKLQEKDREIDLLRQRDALNTDAISTLSDKLAQVVKEIEVLKQDRS